MLRSPIKHSPQKARVFKKMPKKAESKSTKTGTLAELQQPKLHSTIAGLYFPQFELLKDWQGDIKARSSMENFPQVPQFVSDDPFRITEPLECYSTSSDARADPLDKIVSNTREFQIGSRRVNLKLDGSVATTSTIESVFEGTPTGSKRNIDFLEFTNVVLPRSPFSSMILSAKKRRYQSSAAVPERLDNSCTVRVKDILRMVDDSLVSSDTENMTVTSVSGKEDVSISADDLNFAKFSELEDPEFKTGFNSLHSIAINNNFKSMALRA